MTGDDVERLFLIIPTDKDILCKWFGLCLLYGYNDDCKFLEQLLTSYSNTPIVYNSNSTPLANGAYIELLNKAVVINSTRGVLSDALQKLCFGSTSNSQSHSHSNSPKHTSQPDITITQSAPAFKQDSDHSSLFDPPFEDPVPEIKNEVVDSASLGNHNIRHAEPIATIRDCSVVLTRLTDTLIAQYKANLSQSSLANKDIPLPAIPNTIQSVNPGLVIFGDLHNCLQSKPTTVSGESRVRVVQPNHVVQRKSQIQRPYVKRITNDKNRGGRPSYAPFKKPDHLVLIAPKPTLVPSVTRDYPPRSKRKYVKRKQLKSKSEKDQDRPLTVIIAKSQVNNTTIEQSLIHSSNVVRIPIEQSSSSEIGLEMDVSDDRFTTDSDPAGTTNSQIGSTSADVNMPLSGGVPVDENVPPSVVLQDHSSDDVDDLDHQVPELGSHSIFSPVPAAVKIDVEGVDEESETVDGRDSLLEGWLGHLVTLGSSKEQLTEVAPGDGATGLAVSKSTKTYKRTPVRCSSRLEQLHFEGEDYHQMEYAPHRRDTTLELVDFNGQKLDEEELNSAEGISKWVVGTPLPVLKYGTFVQEGELQYIRCNFCKCQLELGVAYTSHAKMHLENVCYCDQCGEGCLDRKKLEAHVWNKHVFRCRYCLDISSFPTMINRDDHERVEHIAFHHARVDPAVCAKPRFNPALCSKPRRSKGSKPPKSLKMGDKGHKKKRLKNSKKGFSKKVSRKKGKADGKPSSAEGPLIETPDNSLVCFDLENSLEGDQKDVTIPIDNKELFKCMECNITFKNRLCYDPHMVRHWEQKSGIECQQCGKFVESRMVLDDHLREHSMLELFCSYCPERFTIKANLDNHEAVHLEHHHVMKEPNQGPAPPLTKNLKRNRLSAPPHIVCYICGKQVSKESISTHIRMHDLLSGKVECKFCGRGFQSERRLNSHIKRMHKKVKSFICDQCGKAFDIKPSLRKHMRIHSGELPFPCSFCDKKFRSRYNRSQHENLHKPGIKKYECEVCSKRFVQSSALIQHRRQHTGFKVTEEYKRVVALKALELGPTSTNTESSSL